MTSLEERAFQAGAAVQTMARDRAARLGDVDELLDAARSRRRARMTAGAAVAVVAVAATVWLLPGRPGALIDDAVGQGESVRVWSDVQVTVPAGWTIADRTLTPSLMSPEEILSASTAAMPIGGDRCANVPEAAIEQLGPADAFVTVQRGFPVEPDDPVIGALQEWPEASRDRTEFAECPDNGDQLTTYWFHAQLDGGGYYILGVFGAQAGEARRQQALAIVNSLQVPAATASSSPSDPATSALPPKCPPPMQSIEIEAGPNGNEWTLPVGNGDAASVEVTMTVPPDTTVELARAEVLPADGPDRAFGGLDFDPDAPPGPPVVWWTNLADDDLRPGQHSFEISWGGSTTSGEPAPPDRYHLTAFAVVRYDGPPEAPCDPDPSVTYVGVGLGYFTVAPPP